MSVNSDFFGTLDTGDEDWIAVDLTAGQSVLVQLFGGPSGVGTLNFLSFTVYDPEGNELGEYDATAAILEPNAI